MNYENRYDDGDDDGNEDTVTQLHAPTPSRFNQVQNIVLRKIGVGFTGRDFIRLLSESFVK